MPEPVPEAATPKELLLWARAALERAGLCFAQGTDNAHDEAAWLLAHGLGEPVERPLADPGRALRPGEARRVQRLVEQRIRTRRPAAYLTGSAWFCGLEFAVDERVIVPRSPIAELIRRRFGPWCRASRVRRILDLCTGCGCIAVACARAFPQARVDACDIDPGALQVARENVARHRVQGRVRVLRSNVFDALAGERYDLIVSNPPYVPSRVVAALPEELRREPRLALDGGGSGMDVVARIVQEAERHLAADGVLVVEVGDFSREFRREFPGLRVTWPRLQGGGSGVIVTRREALGKVSIRG